MLEFNLKKKQARKELYYKKNNFVADLGIELINKKTDLILHKPNSSILSDERLKLKNSSGNEFIINDIDLIFEKEKKVDALICNCLLYTSPSPRDQRGSRMPSSA